MNNKKLQISENCVSEKLDDELIILDLESGLYHSLNEIGYFIWKEIPTSKTLLGALLVIISSIIIFRREMYLKKKLSVSRHE